MADKDEEKFFTLYLGRDEVEFLTKVLRELDYAKIGGIGNNHRINILELLEYNKPE